MNISEKGVMLIKAFEGFRSTAYQDTGGIWTIGWGQTGFINGKKIEQGTTITCDEGEQFLQNQFSARGIILQKKANNYGVILTQNQFDVFMSRMYNFGVNHKLHDTLLQLIKNNSSADDVKNSIISGTHDKAGNLLRGLVIRRNAEYQLWSTGQLNSDVIDRYNSKIKQCGGKPIARTTVASNIDDRTNNNIDGNIDGNINSNDEKNTDDNLDLNSAYDRINAFLLTGKSMSDSIIEKKDTNRTDSLNQEVSTRTILNPTHKIDTIFNPGIKETL